MTLEQSGFGYGFTDALVDSIGRPIEQAEVVAGLLAVGVAHHARHRRHVDARGALVATRAARTVFNIPLRARLLQIIRLSDRASDTWPLGITKELTEYGAYLHDRGHFNAADDTLSVVTSSCFSPVSGRLYAMQQRGFAARMDGRFEDAQARYDYLLRDAMAERDRKMALQARLGLAFVAIELQGPAEARPDVVGIAAEAEACGQAEIFGRAHHALAWICGLLGDPDAVLRHATLAYPHIATRRGRDRLLSDVAEAARDKRMLSHAERMARWLAEHAEEQGAGGPGATARELLREIDAVKVVGADEVEAATRPLRIALADLAV